MPSETREILLRTLRSRSKCTVKELAEVAGVSPVSVRHHLTNLMADGLAKSEEVRHGVGRPHHVYSLTDAALELFPTRYMRLTNRLLEEIKDSMPPGMVEELFASIARSMSEEYASRLEGLPLDERLQRLAQFLEDEGFETEIEQRGDQVIIHEKGCPYLRIGLKHREVCLIDQAFMATALSMPVSQVSCVLDGDQTCTFLIDREATAEEAAPDE